MKFFYTLEGIQARSESSRSLLQESEEVIDHHLFVEALALVAAELEYSDPEVTATQRICHLMERLSDSQGPVVVGVKKFDMVGVFREKYPHFFQTRTIQKKPTFSDLMY